MIHLKQDQFEAYAFQKAKNNNTFCGDSYFIAANDHYFLCVLADGLGSGEFAYEASHAVTAAVKSNPEASVDTLMCDCNKALLGKRGAAVAILKVNFQAKEYEYGCIGNIRTYLFSPLGKANYLIPVTGYLSGKPQKFRNQRDTYEPGSRFFIHSDGFIHMDTKLLVNNAQSISVLAEYFKGKHVNTNDDMSFIIGSLP